VSFEFNLRPSFEMHVMTQQWNDLLFMHWPVPAAKMRTLVPAALELDLLDESAWVSVTPFHLDNLRPRWLPPMPWVSSFPEVNVRTYVTHGGKAGVYFFSLDAGNRLAVAGARATYHLPYYRALMTVTRAATGRATTDIPTTPVTPSAIAASISPRQDPTQSNPTSSPQPVLCRQRRRKYRFSGVSS